MTEPGAYVDHAPEFAGLGDVATPVGLASEEESSEDGTDEPTAPGSERPSSG
jgi:hypothetical protein